jgi:hypothetical protein
MCRCQRMRLCIRVCGPCQYCWHRAVRCLQRTPSAHPYEQHTVDGHTHRNSPGPEQCATPQEDLTAQHIHIRIMRSWYCSCIVVRQLGLCTHL